MYRTEEKILLLFRIAEGRIPNCIMLRRLSIWVKWVRKLSLFFLISFLISFTLFADGAVSNAGRYGNMIPSEIKTERMDWIDTLG